MNQEIWKDKIEKIIELSDIHQIKNKLLSKRKIIRNCWNWSGPTFESGYGRIYLKRYSIRTHRLSFYLFKGKLLQNRYIDHICKNITCFNPDHLRQVTPAQNTLENSKSPTAINKNKTHCINGHELTLDNIYNQKNTTFRYCRKCARNRTKKWYLKKKKEKLIKNY